MEKVLTVNDLKISFRTGNGKVQAVRNISFDLNKGETLAIVGESGSGKSVTSRAILGILAPNAIVESGEIIYDGKDLLKIAEDDFHEIRGDKIAMIFQDPMSSLNPIMRVGKQLTEAMLLKGKANQSASKKAFNYKLKLLEEFMNLAYANGNEEIIAQNKAKCKAFDTFEYKHTQLELAYNNANEAIIECIGKIEELLFEMDKKVFKNVLRLLKTITVLAPKCFNPYLVTDNSLNDKITQVSNLIVSIKANKEYLSCVSVVKEIQEILTTATKKNKPNFFALGYFMTFATEPLPEMEVLELNKFLRKYLDDNFMLEFISCAQKGIEFSYNRSLEAKKDVIEKLDKYIEFFKNTSFGVKEVKVACKEIIAEVENSIDRLSVKKDSTAYTFHSSLLNAVRFYHLSVKKNIKEESRYASEQKKWQSLKDAGKNPDWKVVPPNVVDLLVARQNVVDILENLKESYLNFIKEHLSPDFKELTVDMIDFLKEKASGVVKKVTYAIAKHRAIQILEEVGIPEPRRRFKQYPFEFSGGMRQRIVIAIALAANPDILICDEPTTALDVTIQSQILELINKLKVERQLSIIFITHDLGVVANMADKIAVMYAGKIVEYGTDEDIFYRPAHPYTWALLSSMPDLDTKEKLEAIPGTPPNMIFPPKGDAFAARNKYAMEIDFEEEPPMFEISPSHKAATWLLHPNAPKVKPPKIIADRIKRMATGGK